MLDKLYENIGGKLKSLTKCLFVIEFIGAIIIGPVCIFSGGDLVLYGLLILMIGPLAAWVSSWVLYAFGQLVEDVHAIRDQEGTTEKAKAEHDAELTESRDVEVKHAAEKNDSPEFMKKQKMSAWDHWNDKDHSFGKCEICKIKNLSLLFVEYEDSAGKHQKNICYDCFCERDCRPVEERE